MKNVIIHFWLALMITGCESTIECPEWANRRATICVQKDSLIFRSNTSGWEASLHCFTHNVPVIMKSNSDGFVLRFVEGSGVIEGPARLVLSNDDKYCYFKFNLINESAIELNIDDYRSPKTINPDSSLIQHQIVHQIDQWRNIRPMKESNQYFNEKEVLIDPKVGFYRVFDDKPLSSYYVQAGSCNEINLSYIYNDSVNCFEVTTGPLRDDFSNPIAEGTLVNFIYIVGEKYYNKYVQARDGYAALTIDEKSDKTISVYAQINETKSESLLLTK